MKTEILKAYVRIREIDHTIPDNVLDYMKDASLDYATLKAQREDLLGALEKIADGTNPANSNEAFIFVAIAKQIAREAIENANKPLM